VWLGHAKYVGEYCKYCDAWSAVTVIRSRDVAVKSCLEWLTRSYVISDGVGTVVAPRLKMLCLHVIIHRWNLIRYGIQMTKFTKWLVVKVSEGHLQH